MMRTKEAFFAFGVVFLSSLTYASDYGVLVGGLPVCTSSAALDEFVDSSQEMIKQRKCFMMPGGLPVAILDGMFTMKVRVHLPNGSTVVVFTPSQNVRRN